MMLLSILTIFSVSVNANELENVKKVDGGYFLTDENIIALANYIQELQAENTRLLGSVEALTLALQEERLNVDRLISEKDKVIKLQDDQIKDLKFLYENNKPTLFDKAYLLLGGAGVAATILLIAKTL